MAKVTTPTYYFGDPNNPGINSGTYTPNYSEILPPYNRKVGRGPTGREANCLYNFRLAGDGEVYQRTCAEDPGNNSVKHKIKMRNVVCFAGCWYEHFELDALKSECKFFSTKDLIISKRICARIASPPGDGYSADPGYMQGTDSAGRARGQHLDKYGVTQWDDLVTDENGTEYPIFRPKICAYDDPWLLDLWTVADPRSYGSLVAAVKNLRSGNGSLEGFLNIPLDIFDMNPISQPFHSTSGVSSPVANLLITLLQFYISYQTMGPQILEAIIMMVMSAIHVPGMDTAGEVMGIIFEVINFMLKWQANTVLAYLQANNQVNKYAYSNYGCVNLPLGDYPPNYCPKSASIVSGLLDSICSTDSSGNLYQNCYGSTTTQTDQTSPYNLCSPIKCVQSNYDNNFLNNTVRIGYTHPVQVCSTTLTNNCVNISGSLTRTSAMANSNFVLGSGLSLVSVGNVTINSTKQYRVLYQVLNAAQTNIIEVSNYSYVDLPDCGSATNGYSSPTGGSVIQSTQFCQSIWGVDLGEYSDSFNISVSPTTTAPTGPLSTSSSPVSLPYVDVYTGASFNNKFYVQINQQTEDYSHICAYQTYPGTSYDDTQIGCIGRASMPTPTISSCSTATHVSPCATLTWTARGKTGTNYTANATMTVPQFTPDWSSLPADPILYLGGASFSARVVDSSNLTIPYQPTDSNDTRIVSYNGTVLYNSMWGNYLSSIMPSSTCNQDTCAVYLNGLEYMGGHYVRGGSYLCIDNSKGCQNDTTQCVLAKNYTSFDGASTWTSVSPNDRTNPNTTSASLTSSQYYTYDNDVTLPSNQNIRSKIGLENSSMCVTVPPATCSASTDTDTYYSDWASGTSYYYKATWPSSNTGQLATGICSSNYVAVDSSKMSRYCLLQSTGTTTWDTNNTRLATTFSGCAPSCINSISVSPTDGSSLSGGGNITVSNTSTSTKSADGGTLLIYSTGGAGTNGISGSGTNTITINFNLPYTTSQADIYFTSLQFADYMQISVNGTQITTDSSTIAYNSTSYALWNSATSPSDVGGWRNYTTLDSNLSNLNASLLNNLQTGTNTITINVKTVSGGGFYIGLKYNQLCYTQCSNDNSGYATWTKAAVGGTSVGTCNAGYVAYDSTKMTRYCSLSSSSGALDTVSTGTSTVSGTSSNSTAGTSFGGCLYGACSAVTTASSSTGNAIWGTASYNSYSSGICDTNYVATDLTKMQRLCTIVSNNVTLETIQSNGKTTSGNFAGCTLGVCANDNAGNATWSTSTNAGNYATGICNSGYTAVNATKMQRLCSVSNNVASLETVQSGGSTSSGNFAGCTLSTCISSITGSATQISLASGTSNTVVVGGSTITMSSTNALSDQGSIVASSSSGATNKFYANFNVSDPTKASIYFTNLLFNDYIRVLVNGTQITSDTSSIPATLYGTGYNAWTTSSNPTDLGATRSYKYYDPSYVALNNAVKSNLKTGANTIEVDVLTVGGGLLYAQLDYQAGCAQSCTSDGAGNATWLITPVGSSSTGTCNKNYIANNSAKMTRTCSYNSSGTPVLETVQTNGTTSSGNFAGCKLGTCSNDNAGYATWTSVNAGETSTGICNTGYTAVGSMTRSCQTDSSQTSTYLDTVSSSSFYYSGTSSNSAQGTSFQGCVYNRIDNFSYLVTNYNWTGCRTDIKTSWSGSTYYVSMNTCYSTGGNGVYNNPYALNEYRITFYVPTEQAKYKMGFNHLKFNDYVFVTVGATDSESSWSQVTTDSTNVSGYSLYSSTTSTGGDLPNWRDYANAPGGISSLTDAVRAKLVAGKFNTVRVFLKTILGGGIDWGLWFENPSSTFSWSGTNTTTQTVQTGS